jgi:hypothetical protein
MSQIKKDRKSEKCVCGLNRAARDHTDEICERLRPLKRALTGKESVFSGDACDEVFHSYPLDKYVENLLECAATSDSNYLREESLKYIFLLMTKGYGHSDLAGEQVPLLLIQLERYDDLYHWIRWHLHRIPLSDEQRKLAQSKEFPFSSVEKGCCHRNICEDCSGNQLQSSMNILPNLVVAWILKFRLHLSQLKELERLQTNYQTFLETTWGAKFQQFQISSVVLGFTTETREKLVSRFEQDSSQLAEVIDRRNPSMLPALLWPEPLIENSLDDGNPIRFFLPRCPVEAYTTLKLYGDVFNDTVGARDFLVRRYGGEQPNYHYEPFDSTAEERGAPVYYGRTAR